MKVVLRTAGPASANLQWRKPREGIRQTVRREPRTPIAERLERHLVSLAILSLIELTLKPSLVVRPPKSLAVTLANWRHLVLHLKIYR